MFLTTPMNTNRPPLRLKARLLIGVLALLLLLPGSAYGEVSVCRSAILSLLTANLITNYVKFEFPPGAVEKTFSELLEASEPASGSLSRFIYRRQNLFRLIHASFFAVEKLPVVSATTFLRQFKRGVWYNFVIVGNSMTVGEAGNWKLTQLVAKHIALAATMNSAYAAGAFRIEYDDTLTLTNDSGTFEPKLETIIKVGALLEEHLPGLKVAIYDYRSFRKMAN